MIEFQPAPDEHPPLRPGEVHVWRADLAGRGTGSATILSVESQSKALFAAILAPLLGLAVDLQQSARPDAGIEAFWPVAAAGIAGCAWILLRPHSKDPCMTSEGDY